jgi:hypothetical protein
MLGSFAISLYFSSQRTSSICSFLRWMSSGQWVSYDITFGRVNSEAEISVIEVRSHSNASIQGGDLRNSLADLICLEVGRMSTRRSLVRLLVSHRIPHEICVSRAFGLSFILHSARKLGEGDNTGLSNTRNGHRPWDRAPRHRNAIQVNSPLAAFIKERQRSSECSERMPRPAPQKQPRDRRRR